MRSFRSGSASLGLTLRLHVVCVGGPAFYVGSVFGVGIRHDRQIAVNGICTRYLSQVGIVMVVAMVMAMAIVNVTTLGL